MTPEIANLYEEELFQNENWGVFKMRSVEEKGLGFCCLNYSMISCKWREITEFSFLVIFIIFQVLPHRLVYDFLYWLSACLLNLSLEQLSLLHCLENRKEVKTQARCSGRRSLFHSTARAGMSGGSLGSFCFLLLLECGSYLSVWVTVALWW